MARPGSLVARGGLLLVVGAMTVSFVVGRGLARRFETEPAPPPAPWSAETRYVATRSGRTHVLDVGRGDVVLLTHGSGRSVADWQEGLAAALSTPLRVVAFDNYGFGLSDRRHGLRYGNALWAEQAIDVLDALDIDRAVVVGHSAGGVVAATLAADRPDRIRGAVFLGHAMALDPVQALPLVPGVGEVLIGRMDVFGDTFSESHRRRQLAAYRIRGTRAALLTFIRRQYTIDGLRLVAGTYEDIGVPVLRIHGARDASIPIEAARALGDRLRDQRLVELDGVGHDVHVAAAGRVADEIGRFVAALDD